MQALTNHSTMPVTPKVKTFHLPSREGIRRRYARLACNTNRSFMRRNRSTPTLPGLIARIKRRELAVTA